MFFSLLYCLQQGSDEHFDWRGEVGTRLVIADVVQDIIVKGVAPAEAVKKGHDAMVEIFKALGVALAQATRPRR